MTTQKPTIIQGNVLDTLKPQLENINGEKVLDIATAQGGFIGVLKECLKGYEEIIGLDIQEDLLKKAREAHPEENIRFEVMDTTKLTYPDNHFDTTSLGFSLHHLEDIPTALKEIHRVLKPGGLFIVVEMYRDGLEEFNYSETHIHHWAADIDRARGVPHDHTMLRDEIIARIETLTWKKINCHDFCDQASDPKDKKLIREISGIIDMVLDRAEGLPEYETFKARGEELREMVKKDGSHLSNRLAVLARK
jgi:ubiquinone/menaquinone biosynthesis C-methylase UbiE